ncbi:cell division protein FtsK, partial [Clavibacter sp. DM3]|nr:cell division protein FtsK [Clavibacter zhangzhiyongii]
PEGCWDVMSAVVARIRDPAAPRRPLLVLADDLDVAVSRLEPEHQAALLELVAVIVREGPLAGVALAASARRSGGALQAVAAAAGPPVILPLPSRQEHVLAGGDPRLHDPRATPGAGEWRGERIQVALPPEGAAAPADHDGVAPDPAPPLRLGPDAVHALVTPSPVAAVARLRALDWDAAEAAHLPVGWSPDASRTTPEGSGVPLSAAAAAAAADAQPTGPRVVVADADAWLVRGALLAEIRRAGSVVLEGCAPRDARTLLRVRSTPPPLAPVPGRVWQVTPAGDVHRRSWPTPPPTPSPTPTPRPGDARPTTTAAVA